MSSFWQFFDIQLANFRRVRLASSLKPCDWAWLWRRSVCQQTVSHTPLCDAWTWPPPPPPPRSWLTGGTACGLWCWLGFRRAPLPWSSRSWRVAWRSGVAWRRPADLTENFPPLRQRWALLRHNWGTDRGGLGGQWGTVAEPPENCHLNVKKLQKKQKNLTFFFLKKKTIFVNLFEKNVKFLAIFWQSNGNFPEGQVHTSSSFT